MAASMSLPQSVSTCDIVCNARNTPLVYAGLHLCANSTQQEQVHRQPLRSTQRTCSFIAGNKLCSAATVVGPMA